MTPSKSFVVDLGDGAQTHVDQWGESGPILLGIHGITSSRKSWERLAQHFAADYRLFAYDQRGHGDSAAVHGPMTLERSLLDLEAVVAALPGQVWTLVGHSWGGAVTILGARRIDCDRAIAIDPMIHQTAGTWYADFVDELRALFGTPPSEREPLIRAYYGGAGLPELEIDAKVHAMRSMTLEPIEALGAENRVDEGGWDLRPALRRYPKSLYLPLAEVTDSVVSAPDRNFVLAEGGPKIELETFAGEGHSLHRTAFDRFAARMAAFIA